MSAQTVLVWGANGVSGIAAVHALLEQPSSKISKVIAVSRRPPQIPVDDDRLTFLSIDILKTSSDKMAEKIKAVGGDHISVAHHYTYIEKSDPREATEVNVLLLDRALEATWAAAGNNLKIFHLQTGYKWYGVHLGDMHKAAKLPYVEDAPRCSDDPPNFYYHQVDHLVRHARQHGYSWLETRPNPIIGAAKGNFMNLAVSTCIYLVTERGKGNKQVKYPGNKLTWDTIHIDHSTAINNARFQVWATQPENASNCANEAFNIWDDDGRRMGAMWIDLGRELGIDVLPPTAAPELNAPPPVVSVSFIKWAEENQAEWDKLVKAKGGDPKAFSDHSTAAFFDFIMGATFEQHGSLAKARKAGWTTKCDTVKEGYLGTYRLLEKLGSIPKL